MVAFDNLNPPPAPRPTRTRSWIVAAFNRLVLSRGYDSIGVTEISQNAGVGRSTFYEYFQGKDSVLKDSLTPVLTPLAQVAWGEPDRRRLTAVFDHFRENRIRALAMLNSEVRPRIEEALAALIAAKISGAPLDPTTNSLRAATIAGAQVALIRAWINAESAPTQQAVDVLIATTGAMTPRPAPTP
jgi:AcrR family transcriptional regulator